MEARAGGGAGNVAVMRTLGQRGHVERAQHGGFGGAFDRAMVDRVDQHREAKCIGEKDKFLPLVVAHMAGLGEETDGGLPLGHGEVHVAGEGVEVPDQRLEHLAEARIGGAGEARDDLFR